MNETSAAIARGAAAGLFAGIPQVLIVQAVERPLGLPREKADIGPRFVKRITERLGDPLHPAAQWGLAALFHFGYSAAWGALYGLADQLLRPPPALAGAAMGAVIWTAAFSHWGAGTQTGTEPDPGRRGWRDDVLHWTAALSFSLTTALTCAWLRRSASSAPPGPRPARPPGATVAAGARRAW